MSIHEAVLGFHTKASPCFKAKLVFIGILNPEREFTLTVFLMAPHASRKSFEIHLGIHQAVGVDGKSEIGGRSFYATLIGTSQPGVFIFKVTCFDSCSFNL